MSLVQDHQKKIEGYLGGMISLSAPADWLGETAAAVDGAADGEAKRLSARVWRLISEYNLGHRDEPSVRAELRSLLPVARPGP